MTAVVNGKAIEIGGGKGRFGGTGGGCMIITLLVARHLGMSVNGATVVIQGFGNVGSTVADYLAKEGGRVIAVSDVHGGVYNTKGLDIEDLLRHSRETGSVVGFRDSEAITNAQLLGLKCDILVPAAIANQLVMENAASVKAKMILEVVNGTTQAYAI